MEGDVLEGMDHIAIIVGNYVKSKHFYTEVLGLRILREEYREERNSYKLDLSFGDSLYPWVELFTFPDAPPRLTYPEAQGLRHFGFLVADLDAARERLVNFGFRPEQDREDPRTGQRYFFVQDPDGLPLSLAEMPR